MKIREYALLNFKALIRVDQFYISIDSGKFHIRPPGSIEIFKRMGDKVLCKDYVHSIKFIHIVQFVILGDGNCQFFKIEKSPYRYFKYLKMKFWHLVVNYFKIFFRPKTAFFDRYANSPVFELKLG